MIIDRKLKLPIDAAMKLVVGEYSTHGRGAGR